MPRERRQRRQPSIIPNAEGRNGSATSTYLNRKVRGIQFVANTNNRTVINHLIAPDPRDIVFWYSNEPRRSSKVESCRKRHWKIDFRPFRPGNAPGLWLARKEYDRRDSELGSVRSFRENRKIILDPAKRNAMSQSCFKETGFSKKNSKITCYGKRGKVRPNFELDRSKFVLLRYLP